MRLATHLQLPACFQELDVHHSPYATPGSIGHASGKEDHPAGKEHSGGASKAIWEAGETSDCQHYVYSDTRPEPEYV